MGETLSKITNKILSLITSVSLLLLIYSLSTLRGVQPEGYTINIYEQLPFQFYLILLFCYLSACVMLLAYRKLSAVVILFLVHITVIVIPYMLGYISIGRGEEFSYMELAGQNLPFAPLSISTLSPTGPLLVSTISLITGFETWKLSYFFPVFFSIMFITGMFLFYRDFMSREKLISVAFLSSIIPYFGHFQVSSNPYYLCFSLVPLCLFMLRSAISDKNKKMVVCLFFLIPLIPLAHPFIFVYMFCFSLFLLISKKILNPDFFRKILTLYPFSQKAPNHSGKKIPAFIFLSFVSGSFLLFTKYSSQFFGVFLPSIALRTQILLTVGFSRVPESDSGFFEFLHLFNLNYGKYYIPLIFILINSIIVWQNRKRFCHHFVRRYPRFLILYIATFFIEVGFLLNPFVPYPLDKFANLSFIIFAQIPLLGYSLYIIFLRKGSTFGLGTTVLILCLLWTLGFFTCFNSPYTGGITEAVSQNEAEGIQWLAQVKETPSYIMYPRDVPDPFSCNLSRSYAFDSTSKPIYVSSGSEGVISSPTGKTGKEPFYFVVTTFSEVLSLDKQKSNGMQVSTEPAFEDEGNHSKNKIYDSLNIKIYKTQCTSLNA
jgi:hypothetical protein